MPEMAALVARQEQILLQLADLKEQMLLLKKNLKNESTVQKAPIASIITAKVRLCDTLQYKFNICDICFSLIPAI